jgi:hypothetical protein
MSDAAVYGVLGIAGALWVCGLLRPKAPTPARPPAPMTTPARRENRMERNSLAAAVENARKIAREEFERREREKDAAVGFEAAEAHLQGLEQYLRQADTERVIAAFLEKTEYWPSWSSHENKPLAYLAEEGIRVSNPRVSETKDINAPKMSSFDMEMQGRTYTIEREMRRSSGYMDSDVYESGTLRVMRPDSPEPLLVIAVNQHHNGDYFFWTAPLWGLKECRSVEWLPDFAVVVEVVDAHTKASFKERQRQETVERASKTRLLDEQ